jgi:hypothetical protein
MAAVISGLNQKCWRLPSICIPSSVETLSAPYFSECRQLQTVAFVSGSQLSRAENNAFAEGWSLRSICIPASLSGPFAEYERLVTRVPEASSGGENAADSGRIARENREANEQTTTFLLFLWPI